MVRWAPAIAALMLMGAVYALAGLSIAGLLLP